MKKRPFRIIMADRISKKAQEAATALGWVVIITGKRGK